MRPDRVIVRAVTLAILVGCVVAPSTPQAGSWHAPSDGDVQQILSQRIARGEAVGLVGGVLENGKPRVVGKYELTPAFAIEVTREGAALFVQATGQQKFRAYAASPTRFFLRVVNAEIEFTLDDAGAVTGLVLHQGGQQTHGRRLERKASGA